MGLVGAHGGNKILRVGVLQACLGARILQIQVVDWPVQVVAIGLRGFSGLLMRLLFELVRAQMFLEVGLLTVVGSDNVLLQLANGLI
ncbi:hypothetical protein D3C84_800060 [compost metagenome]